MAINDDIGDNYLEHAVDLLAFGEELRAKVLVVLEDLQNDLARKMKDIDLTSPNAAVKVKRAERLIKQADKTIRTAFAEIGDTVGADLMELADLEATIAARAINVALRAELAAPITTKKTLEVIAKNPLIQGSPMDDWWASQAARTRLRFASQVRLGYLGGETNEQILQRIIGKASGGRRRVLKITKANGDTVKRVVVDRVGGIMNATRAEGTSLVRTAVQTISNQINNETFDENGDIIKGKRLIVTLDGRTSPVCRGRAGAAWDLEGKPLPESPWQYDFPGPPPYHWRCRSILAPIVKSWDELAGMKGIPEIPVGTRASMDGQVPVGDFTYEQWFKTKGPAFQEKVLGPARYEMWKDGKLSMQEMIDPATGRQLTIAELKAL